LLTAVDAGYLFTAMYFLGEFLQAMVGGSGSGL
jgi:hypothetical protein